MPQKVEISHRTIIFTVLLILFLWLLAQVLDIIILVFISFILMSAINPLIDKMESWRLPRSLAIVLVYLVLWGVIGGMVASIIPSLVDQTGRLIRLLPSAVSRIEFFNLHQQEITQQLLARIGSLPENLLKVTVGLFSNLLSVLTTIVVTFYLLLYHKNLGRYTSFLFGSHAPKAAEAISHIERRLGAWVRGELVLMFAVGLLTYIGLIALGVEIALPLAILAGILELVPNIGPVISAIPAVLAALTIHPLTAAGTVCLYFVVQFLENHLLVPKVMQKAVGVNPLVSILSLMSGFRLAGPVGAILAIPVILILQTLGLHFFSIKNMERLGGE